MKNAEPSRNSEINQTKSNQQLEEGLKINGMQQVIDMLRFADPSFRESLLKRIAQRDPQLAGQLRKIIR